MASSTSNPSTTMRALGFKNFTFDSSKLSTLEVPVPKISKPDEILVQVKASSLNGGDGVRPTGVTRLIENITPPIIIGMDFSGIVVAIGSSVTEFRPGDFVYGMTVQGSCCASYLLISSSKNKFIRKMPSFLSFEQAASLPIVAHTTMCALLRAEKELQGGLKGKTVLVSGGLGGCGSVALMLLKPVFGAGKVITTVSTKKVALIPELIGEGLVDQIVDYTKQDVTKEIGLQKVDFLYDTVMMAMQYLPVLKTGTGVIFSITAKSGETLRNDFPEAPWLLVKVLNVYEWLQRWRARRWGVTYDHMWTQMKDENAELMETWIEEGKMKVLIGRTTSWWELEEVKTMFEMTAKWKGSVGKNIVIIN